MPHIVGNCYTNEEINLERRCAIMGGIRKSNTTNSIVLIHVPGSIYNNRVDPHDPDIFLFTGQGLSGNQMMNRNNLALSRSGTMPLHLYVYDGPKRYRYVGVYAHAGKTYTEKQLDKDGILRDVFIFPIKPL